MEQERVSRPTGEDITTKESGVQAGTKLKSLFPLLFSLFTVQDWMAILYTICFCSFMRCCGKCRRKLGKGFGPVCSISFSHDTSTGWSVLRTGYVHA